MTQAIGGARHGGLLSLLVLMGAGWGITNR